MFASTRIVFLLALAGATCYEAPASLTRARNRPRNQSAQSPETARRAEGLLQEALVLSGAKERELARARLSEAMQLWMQASEAGEAAGAAVQMGDRYAQAGRFQDSLYCYEQGLTVSGLDVQTRAAVHNSIAKLYAGLYQRDLALSHYHQAIKLTQGSRAESARALALTGLADIYRREGDRKQALACLAEARQLGPHDNTDAEAALTYLTGLIDLEEGHHKQALQSLEEALAIYRRVGETPGQVKVICSISNLYLASGQTQLAVEYADRAVDLAEKEAAAMVDNAGALRAAEMRWRAWFSHARAHRAAGEKERAINSFGRAIFPLEGLYWSVYVATETSAVAFREELQAPYRELADLLIEQGQSQKAFEWAERARARVMLGMSEARRMRGRRGKDDEEERLRVLSESTARLRAQLESTQVNRKQRAWLEARINDAREAMDEARSKLEMQRARERLIWFQPAGIKKLQERLVQTGEVILEYLVGEKRSFAWLLSSRDVSLEILPGRKEIEKQLGEFMELMSAAPNNLQLEADLTRVRERGERLFLTLFGRLYEQIPPGKKLIVVPDRVLHNLPFEALLHEGRYLVEDHEISYVPSGSMLGLWQDSKDDAGTKDKMEILAFGDPDFGPEPKTSSKRNFSVRLNVMRQSRVSRGFRLAPLPRTQDEVRYIAQLFPPERRRVYLGKNATEGALKGESLHRFRRLHFATHSLIDEVSPSRSAVVLSLDVDQNEDGFLEVSEISELDLDCDVVVLSACQTARGQLLSGEGIVGLSRAFLYAGARAVVVSLWNVSDISTGQLMKSFYRHLTAGIGNAAALRETKLQMLKSGRETRHPYYWASFITIGRP